MAVYYVDTSALVKVYVAEAGTGWIQALTRPSARNVVITSRRAAVELEVAIVRKASERAITAELRDRSILLFRRHIQRRYGIISLTDDVCARALDCIHLADLPHPLRTYDAMHLASARIAADALVALSMSPLTFIAADLRLLTIARHLGFATDNPEDHS
jgi:hypothetical protein